MARRQTLYFNRKLKHSWVNPPAGAGVLRRCERCGVQEIQPHLDSPCNGGESNVGSRYYVNDKDPTW